MSEIDTEAAQLFLVRHQGDGADACLIRGRVAMAAHVRNMTVGSDDIEDVSEAGMTEHLRVLLDEHNADWHENGEPPSYSMDFEDGAITVFQITSSCAPEPAQQGNSAPIAPGLEDLWGRVRGKIEDEIRNELVDLCSSAALVDSYSKRLAPRILALLDPLISATAAQARREALEAAAKVCDARVEQPYCRVGGIDPSTGTFECSLEVRGKDCLCAERTEEAESLATAIRALDPRREAQEAGR